MKALDDISSATIDSSIIYTDFPNKEIIISTAVFRNWTDYYMVAYNPIRDRKKTASVKLKLKIVECFYERIDIIDPEY